MKCNSNHSKHDRQSCEHHDHSLPHIHNHRTPNIIFRVLAVTITFMIIEVAGGFLANSLALISDNVRAAYLHMAADSLGSIRPLSKLMVRRFSGLFWPLFDSNCRGNIRKLILPLQFESKSGQNNPEKRRTINFERGLL
jgi:Co/Zn/Cd efflux system component